MKKCTLWLLDGTPVTLKAKTYQELLCEIDNFFDIFKESVSYYLGYSDETIIEEMEENEINFEKEEDE